MNRAVLSKQLNREMIDGLKNNIKVLLSSPKNKNDKAVNNEIKKIKDFNNELEIINKIIVGDCLEVMKKVKDNTFDMIFADPPYNMQLQNELYRPNNTKVDAVDDEWDQFNGFGHYDEFSKAWLREAKKVLKKTGQFGLLVLIIIFFA